MEQTNIAAGEPSRNRSNGQVTVILLLIALPLLALLVVQQGRVIETQRILIRQLNSDSQQLNAIRMHELQNRSKHDHASAAPQADAPHQSQPSPAPTPEQKSPKPQSKRAAPPPPQEYPATRVIPVRKSV